MRVLYVEMAYGFGGSLTSLMPLFRNLPAEVEPVLVTGFDARRYVSLPDHVAYEQVAVPQVPDSPAGPVRQLTRFYQFNASPWMKQLSSIIKQHKPDLIHTGNSAFYNAPAAFVGWRNNIPTIGFQKGFEYNGSPNRFVLRSGWYDHHVACSTAIANCLFELGLPRERCSIMYDGVAPPPDGFDAERRTDRTPVIAMYSLLQQWKGQDVFLKAVAKVVEKYPEPFCVVIAGDSPDGSREFPDYLKALAAELGIADRVDFRGHIRNVWQLLAETDIAVHASTKPEPFGTVVAEAMIAGVAVIATKGGGVAEYVKPGETGLQVEMGDVDGMAQAIERLLRDAELRRSLAQRGRDFALKEFRPSLYAERMTELYRRVLARRN